MIKTFTSSLERLDSNIWGLYFSIPKAVSDYFLEKGVKRFVYTLNGTQTIHRAMLSHGDGTYFLYVNKPLMKALGLPIGTKVEIEMRADTSEYGMPMPEEFKEALLAYPDADAHFHALTKGKQRNLIYMVENLKRVESRVKKAIQIVEYLEHSGGRIDFRELNNWFKIFNSR
jgi:hypothetical protein